MTTGRLTAEARPTPGMKRWRRQIVAAIVGGVMLGSLGCARLPYTVKTIHEDRRVVVTLQQEVTPARYSHPVQLTPPQVAQILAAFSFREKQRLPLRWFAEETPPKPVFRQDELEVLAPFLSEALAVVGPEQRVHFQVLAPGMNPAQERDTTAGWIVARDPYLHFALEHFHAQFPIRHQEMWDNRYPALPPEPGTFLLYFEPNRFWSIDPATEARGVLYRDFLKSAILPAK